MYVKLEDLVIDEWVADILESYGTTVGKYHNNLMAFDTFPLSEDRLDDVLVANLQHKALPPIRVRKLHSKYIVLDGRHRIAAAILLEIPIIKAFPIENKRKALATLSSNNNGNTQENTYRAGNRRYTGVYHD